LAVKPLLVVPVPLTGPAEIAGIPLADAMVEQLRATANIEPVLVDDDGLPIAIGKQTGALSPKLLRALLLRDGHCRIPGCEVNYGLHAHHLQPKSWGGGDELSDVAMVCTAAGHHQMLIRTDPGLWSGTPICPTDSNSSTSTISTPNRPPSSDFPRDERARTLLRGRGGRWRCR
jgi:hypothetical protein